MGTNRKKGVAPPRCDEAFKAGVVKLVTEQGRPSTEVAKELDICIDTLRNWLKASAGVSTGQADRQKPGSPAAAGAGGGGTGLAQFDIRQSMFRKGDPYEILPIGYNAVAENFFSCLKCELIHLRRFDIRAAAQNAVFAYIEGFYNSLRPHSAIGWIPPNIFAARFSQFAIA